MGLPGTSIAGTVFDDLNGDGLIARRDAAGNPTNVDEPGLGGIIIRVLDRNGNIVRFFTQTGEEVDFTTTAADGTYEISAILDGDYKIQFDYSNLSEFGSRQLSPANVVDPILGIDESERQDSDAIQQIQAGIAETAFFSTGTVASRQVNLGLIPPSIDDSAAIDLEKYVRPIIEVPNGGEGLSPGFWKTHSRFGPAPEAGWAETGFDPQNRVDQVFGVDFPGDRTMLEALRSGGGGVNALLRQATAALLNASNPFIDYKFTPFQVISSVQTAVTTGRLEALKSTLEQQNELGANLQTPATSTLIEGTAEDADETTGPSIAIGNQAKFEYTVQNTGTVALKDVLVTDDRLSPIPVQTDGFNVGDRNQNDVLDVGETWHYVASEAVSLGQQTNLGSVSAIAINDYGDPLGLPPVTDADTANYLGVVPTPI
jgi:hypothetical protein